MRNIMRSQDVAVRKSPSVSATVYPVGYRMVGNDGNMWQIVRDSRGVQRWQKQAGGGYDMPKPEKKFEQYVPKKAKKKIAVIEEEDIEAKEEREMDEYYSKMVPVEVTVQEGIIATKARKSITAMKQILQDDPDMASEVREVAQEKLEGYELFESSDPDAKIAADLYRDFLRESFKYGGKVKQIDDKIKRYEAAMHRNPSPNDQRIISQKINQLKEEKRFV